MVTLVKHVDPIHLLCENMAIKHEIYCLAYCFWTKHEPLFLARVISGPSSLA